MRGEGRGEGGEEKDGGEGSVGSHDGLRREGLFGVGGGGGFEDDFYGVGGGVGDHLKADGETEVEGTGGTGGWRR